MTTPHTISPQLSAFGVPLLVAALLAAPSPAALTIDRVEPGGAPRGGEVEVQLTGKEFVDPEQLWFEEAGIEVVALAGVDATHAKATLRIPADCRLGSHRFRLRTRQGLSELRTFRVGTLPQAPEQEPNNDPRAMEGGAPPPDTATPRTITGVVKGEDVDCFPVRAAAGDRIAVAIDAIRLDQEMFDPYVDIVDARGFVLAFCDDHPLLGQDAMLAATAPADGTYFIRVRESAYGGNDGCVYLLHVGRFPVAHLAWPPGGAPGATLDVEWLGDPAGPFRGTAVLPSQADATGLAEVRPERDGLAAPVGVPLRVSPLPPALEAEPNNEPGKAGRVAAPAGLVGRLDAAEDVDWFRVEAPKGSAWQVRGWGRRLGSPIDLVVNVHRDNDKRERISGNDDTDGPDSEVRLTVPEEGSFLVRVSDHRRRGGPTFVYWLDVEPAEPGVVVSVPPGRSNTQERLVAVVPKGNRTAVVFNTARTDFGEPVQLAFEGLPAGLHATAPPAVGNAPGTFAVFEAPADAQVGVALVGVRTESVAAESSPAKRLGGLRQATELVLGPPNNAAYRWSVGERLPMAVVAAAPITVDVEAPTVPLARRGTLDLKVRITRQEGFTGKVRLAFPFKPPGLGAPVNVDIAEDASEAVYPLNASADAALGDRSVVVAAAVKDKDDPSNWVSSLPVTVRVCEQPVELAAEKAVVELGQETKIVCKVTKPGTFEGVAKVKLMGLPQKTAADELDLPPTATELVFPVRVEADASPGRHDNVFCQVRVPLAGGWVVYGTPATQLRIDKPLPKPAAAGDAPAKKEGGS